LSYRKEAFRQSWSMKTVGLLLVFNLVAVIALGSLVLLKFERKVNPDVDTYGDAVYLTLITVATVGYGDSYPVTAGGKVTVVLEILIGVSLLTAFFGVRAGRKEREAQRRAKTMETNVKIGGQYLVCGWNQRAAYLIERLKAELEPSRTPIVLLCDQEVNPCEDEYPFFIRGSPVSERDLERANVREAEAAILMADESRGGDTGDQDARTVLSALTIRSLNPGIRMTAELLQPENTHHLQIAGVGEIYDSNVIAGSFLAQSAIQYGTIGIVTEMATKKPGERVYRIGATGQMAGMTREQLEKYVEEELDGRLLAVNQEGQLVMPTDDVRISAGDILAIISEKEPPGAC
jgi:voltage-gated potassium channel